MSKKTKHKPAELADLELKRRSYYTADAAIRELEKHLPGGLTPAMLKSLRDLEFFILCVEQDAKRVHGVDISKWKNKTQ